MRADSAARNVDGGRIFLRRMLAALAIPLVALAVQWTFWEAIRPYVWFLFFPAVFFSSWVGGFAGGLAATVMSALIVTYFFIPPAFSFILNGPMAYISVFTFVGMGFLFSLSHERLRRANLRAARALDETRGANVRITELYQKTRELDELKTRFFANVSHELRTPLTLILGPVKSLLAGSGLSPEQRVSLEVVERNGRMLLRHVSDLLDVAKLDAGRLEMRYAEADLSGLARFVASHFESLDKERSIHLRVDVPDVLSAQVDVAKCQRILFNLLSNAFKFTPEGGQVSLALRSEDGQAVFTVSDTGPGVPPDMREAVFERFRQLDGAGGRTQGGTGLGLAIVKEFALRHGGSAVVTGGAGGGAAFVVRLPLRAPAGTELVTDQGGLDADLNAQAVEELRLPDRLNGHARTSHGTPAADVQGDGDEGAAGTPLVLVVEDNPDMNDYVARNLRAQYRVATAFDGREGLTKALTLAPDLILSDVMMPEMDGEEMVMALRRHKIMDDVPIVMLTAKADDEVRLKMLRERVQDYLYKPFAVEELLSRVDSLLRDRRRHKEDLRRRERFFQTTFEQAAVGIAHLAPNGRWLRVNRKLCEITGYSAEELLERTFQDITHPDDLDADNELAGKVLAGSIQTYSMEKRYIRKDGSVVWINLTVGLVRDDTGEPDYFLSVIEDIAERKRAELALAESELKLRTVADFTYDWEYWRGEDGRLIWVSPACARVTGYAAGEFMDRPKLLGEIVHHEDTATVGAHLESISDPKTGPAIMEFRILHRDGRVLWISHRSLPVFDRSGGYLGRRVNNRDITERKLDEENLRRALAEKTTLLQEVHHRVKNNLQIIASLFSLQSRQTDDPSVRDILLSSINRIRTMSMVHEQLYASRNLSGIDMDAHIEKLLQNLSGIYGGDQHIAVVSSLDAVCLSVDRAIPCALIANELVTNAFKHAFPGAASGEIRIGLRHADGRIRLSVADNGAGLPPGFDPRQSDTLGFQLLFALSEQLGGVAEVRSNGGTECVVDFPEDPPAA